MEHHKWQPKKLNNHLIDLSGGGYGWLTEEDKQSRIIGVIPVLKNGTPLWNLEIKFDSNTHLQMTTRTLK